jgi:hypothetical protein
VNLLQRAVAIYLSQFTEVNPFRKVPLDGLYTPRKRLTVHIAE